MDENFIVDFGEVTRVITEDFNKLNNRPSYAGELMTGDTNIPQVPSSVSELNNDSNYQTGAQVSEAIETEKEAREAADTALDGRLTTVEGIAATALQPSSIDKVVMTDINVGANTSTTTFNLDASKQNLLTGATSSKQVSMPVASSTEAGIMNSATFDAVANNTANINALANGAVAITGLPSSPTQAQLTTAWENATGETSLMNRAGIYDVTNGKVWTYYTNDTTWHSTTNTTQVTINTFTNSSEGTIKGSTNVGQVFAEADGTGSVNGWDALNDAVGNNSSDISNLQTAVNGKQDKLIAGTNINIAADGKTISATDTTYTAGNAINITNGEISADIHPADFFTASDSISECGSNLSLDNTIASTLKSVELKGDTFQQGIPSPNPDYPQDIQVVTGEQTVRVTGKNLWGGFINNYSLTDHDVAFVNYKDGSISANGTASSSAYSMYAAAAASEGRTQQFPAGTYTLSGGTSAVRVMFIIVGPGTSYTTDTTSGKVTFTLSEMVGGYIRAYVPSGTSANETIHPQLEFNSTASDYESYQSQSYTVDLGSIELCKISDYQDYIYKSGDDWYLHKEVEHLSLAISDMNNGEDYPGWMNLPILTDTLGVGKNSKLNQFTHYKANMCLDEVNSSNYAPIQVNTNNNTLYFGKSFWGADHTQTYWKTTYPSLTMELYYGIITTITDTKITDATLVGQLEALAGAMSYNNQTNVIVTATGGNLPATLCVEAYRKSLNGLLGVIERLGA